MLWIVGSYKQPQLVATCRASVAPRLNAVLLNIADFEYQGTVLSMKLLLSAIGWSGAWFCCRRGISTVTKDGLHHLHSMSQCHLGVIMQEKHNQGLLRLHDHFA